MLGQDGEVERNYGGRGPGTCPLPWNRCWLPHGGGEEAASAKHPTCSQATLESVTFSHTIPRIEWELLTPDC